MEIEAKFSAPDAATLERLGELGELAGYELAGHEVADMTDVYLDTDDRALRAAGLVCRRRDRGDRVVITVKRRGDATASDDGSAASATSGPGADAIHRRDEWETELPGALAPDAPPASWPTGEAREQVLAAARERPLAALVEVRQSRVLRTVAKNGRTVAELSLDTLSIVAADGPLPAQHEVEAELKDDGTEADLAQIAASLRSDFALTPQPLSKFERAMAALAAEPSASGLLSGDEEHLLARISRRTDAVGRRARVLLALHEGALQRDAAARAGMAPRTVRYWLNRFRHEGLAIFPKRLVAGASRRPASATPAAGAARAAATPAGAAAAARAGKKARAKAKRDRKVSPSPMTAVVAAARTTPAGAPAARPPAEVLAARPAAARTKRPARPGIRSSDTMAEAAFKTLHFHLERMLEHEPGTRQGDDPEDLHDMRVATRRMRAVLRVFGPYLDTGTMRPVERGLRRTGRVLGAVRDLDVFHEKTVSYLESLPDEHRNDLDPLLAVWRERREHARAEMIEYLDGGRYPRFVEAFSALLDDPGRASLARTASPTSCRPCCTTASPPCGPTTTSSPATTRRSSASTDCASPARPCATPSSSSRRSWDPTRSR
jgi:inorganic triphosphatase YgiF